MKLMAPRKRYAVLRQRGCLLERQTPPKVGKRGHIGVSRSSGQYTLRL